jgi:mannose-6-phosphate isomerase-like protein (cupin superfamily)
MEPSALTVLDLHQAAATVSHYQNLPLSLVNDHVVRLSIMTEPFYWHYHPNSDESFLVLEGVLCIDLAEQTVELTPGQLFTIPAGVLHRTRPREGRTVNVTFERADLQTVQTEPES